MSANDRELDLTDNVAYLLHGATIKGAYRRKNYSKDLVLAGMTDDGKPFVITLSATICRTFNTANNEAEAVVVAVPTCGDKEIERIVKALKEDIDKAEAAPQGGR